MANREQMNSAGMYAPQQGWVQSPFWEEFANSFAEDGSEQQLLSALTHATPEDWLNKFYKDKGFNTDADKQWANQNAINYTSNPAGKPVSRLEDPNEVISNYSKGLQKRLVSDFNKNFGSSLERGKANLRDQAQMGLDEDFGAIDENANSRGLLYSGKRQSARAGAAANKASQLGEATGQYEKQLNDTRRELNAGNIGMDINSLAQQQDLNSLASGAFYNKLQQDLVGTEQQLGALSNLGYDTGSAMGTFSAKGKKA